MKKLLIDDYMEDLDFYALEAAYFDGVDDFGGCGADHHFFDDVESYNDFGEHQNTWDSYVEHAIYAQPAHRDYQAQYRKDVPAYVCEEKERKKKKYWENVEETRQNSKQYDAANRERVRELTRERVKRHRAKKKSANENRGFGRNVA